MQQRKARVSEEGLANAKTKRQMRSGRTAQTQAGQHDHPAAAAALAAAQPAGAGQTTVMSQMNQMTAAWALQLTCVSTQLSCSLHWATVVGNLVSEQMKELPT